MKTIFRFLGTGVLSAAVVAVGAVAGFGQGTPAATPNANCADIDGHNALYTKFTGVYNKKALADVEVALATGKEYLEKFGTCTEAFKEQIDFVKPHVVRIEKEIGIIRVEEPLKPFYKRFDAGIGQGDLGKSAPAANIDELYISGKEILAKKPDDINFMVPLAVAGFYEMFYKDEKQPRNTKYTEDSLRYAQTVLAQVKGGKAADRKSSTGVPIYGFLKYAYTKEDLISELNYAIGYLNFYPKNNKLAALPYYYELSQSGRYKDDPRIYQTIGSYFGSEVLRMNGEVAKLIAEQKAKATEEEKLALEPKIKETIGILNGTAERAMDYYGRAYKLAKSDTPAAKTYKDALYRDLSILYEGRFNKKDGLDAYIATVTSKPVPNPTTPITPVNDPEPTTTTTGAAPATKPAATTAAPASTTAVKPATKPMSTTTKTSPVAKKGTRK